jgi:thiamine pyrophosphate-dependent acetolactate synthase large subunit-like protein
MKVFQAITDSFVAEGIDTVFSLMGDSNMMFHDDLVRRQGVRVVNARHENAAVAMADGLARSTGTVGVATVTCGPGLTQIATSLTVASRLRVPIVVFVGDTPSTDLWNPQSLDFGANVLPTGAVHAPIRSIERIAETVGFAFLTAKRDRRPVVVSIPYDLQELEVAPGFTPLPSSGFEHLKAVIHPDGDAVKTAAAVLMAAERPVIVAGRGAIAADARDAVILLAERTGALLATSLKAKNWFDGEEWNLGVCGSLGSATGRELVAEADVVVGVGAQLGYFGRDNNRLFPAAEIVQVDLSPGGPIEGAPFRGTLVAADARLGIEAIDAALAANGHQSQGFRTADVARRLENPIDDWLPAEDEPGRIDPTLAMRALDAAIESDQQYVFGVGHFWSFAIMNSHRSDPLDFLYAYGFGSIGHALSAAIGAAIGRSRPTVLVDGDGSLLMHIAELGTVVSEDLDLTIIVMNDGGYGSEIHKLRAKGGDGELARFHHTDFATVARGFGLDGHRATSVDDITRLVHAQRATRRPTLIDVPTTMMALSPPTQRIWFPDK